MQIEDMLDQAVLYHLAHNCFVSCFGNSFVIKGGPICVEGEKPLY